MFGKDDGTRITAAQKRAQQKAEVDEWEKLSAVDAKERKTQETAAKADAKKEADERKCVCDNIASLSDGEFRGLMDLLRQHGYDSLRAAPTQ